jgi:hypothetical protein
MLTTQNCPGCIRTVETLPAGYQEGIISVSADECPDITECGLCDSCPVGMLFLMIAEPDFTKGTC